MRIPAYSAWCHMTQYVGLCPPNHVPRHMEGHWRISSSVLKCVGKCLILYVLISGACLVGPRSQSETADTEGGAGSLLPQTRHRPARPTPQMPPHNLGSRSNEHAALVIITPPHPARYLPRDTPYSVANSVFRRDRDSTNRHDRSININC